MYIFATLVLAGCLFISSDILSKSLTLIKHEPVKKDLFYKIPFSYNPNLLNTFNYLFPIYSFDKEVCRKPADYGFSSLHMNAPFALYESYKYKGFFFKSRPMDTHFFHIESNSIYKKGNSLLLIPHSYVIPVSPSYNSEMPRMLIPKSD